MQPWQAFILGVIEGITEYLPISSTGHLLVAQHLMGIGTATATEKAAADTFAICIQGGAILAVLGIYMKRVLQMLRGVLGQDSEGLKLAVMLVVGFLPAAVIGLALNDKIEEKLFGMWPVIVAWIVGGLLVGLSIRAAVEYSFLLGVLTLTAATAKKAVWKVDGLDASYHVWFGGTQLMWDSYGPLPLAVGIVAAAVSAAIAVKWLVSYLQSHGLSVFGWYRIALGVVIGGLVAAGVFTA